MGARTRRLGTRALALLVVLVTSGVGTVATAAPGPVAPEPAAHEPAGHDPAAVTIPARYLVQPLQWRVCDFDGLLKSYVSDAPTTRCATVRVPMDWRHPDAHPDISIAIAYSQATGRSRGLLASNPGGPGSEARDFTGLLATGKPKLFRDYDLLGFDPRGFGASEQASCRTTVAKLRSIPVVDDPRVRSKRAHAAEVATAKVYGEACAGNPFNQFVNTAQTVDDLEFLRRLVGGIRPTTDTRLNYLGYSYGTWLGAWYADRYPTHTGRFILDSNMSWTRSMYANQVTDSFSFQRRRDQMFYPWLARHDDTYQLGRTAKAVAKSYERIRARLLPALARGDFALPPADADETILGNLYADWQFPDAAEWITEFRDWGSTDATLNRKVADRIRAVAAQQPVRPDRVVARTLARAAATGASDQAPVTLDTGGQIVRCNDSRFSDDVPALLRRADADAKKYRFVGYQNTVTLCSYWKFPTDRRSVDLGRAPRILMFQSEGDPATAYEGALAAHRKTKSHTRLVSVDDEGQHGLYIDGPSPCVEQVGDAFLFDGVMPKRDLTCDTTPLPDDTKVYRFKGPLDRHHRVEVKLGVRSATRPPVDLRRARVAAARLSGG